VNHNPLFQIGDYVEKTCGYRFQGVVVGVWSKWKDDLTGVLDPPLWRYTVQNTDGVIHIFNGGALRIRVDV
jgi:hypothetical protein